MKNGRKLKSCFVCNGFWLGNGRFFVFSSFVVSVLWLISGRLEELWVLFLFVCCQLGIILASKITSSFIALNQDWVWVRSADLLMFASCWVVRIYLVTELTLETFLCKLQWPLQSRGQLLRCWSRRCRWCRRSLLLRCWRFRYQRLRLRCWSRQWQRTRQSFQEKMRRRRLALYLSDDLILNKRWTLGFVVLGLVLRLEIVLVLGLVLRHSLSRQIPDTTSKCGLFFINSTYFSSRTLCWRSSRPQMYFSMSRSYVEIN